MFRVWGLVSDPARDLDVNRDMGHVSLAAVRDLNATPKPKYSLAIASSEHKLRCRGKL